MVGLPRAEEVEQFNEVEIDYGFFFEETLGRDVVAPAPARSMKKWPVEPAAGRQLGAAVRLTRDAVYAWINLLHQPCDRHAPPADGCASPRTTCL